MDKLLIDLIFYGAEAKPAWMQMNRLQHWFKNLIPSSFYDPDLMVSNILWIIIVGSSLISFIVDDVVYGFMIPGRLDIHGDSFSVAIVVAKVILHILFLYFNGILFYQNHI